MSRANTCQARRRNDHARAKKHSFDCYDLDVDHQDAGPWRSYELTASGDTFEELAKDATISEIDQDGGELNSYAVGDARPEVYNAALLAMAEACL
jgi:hypothetical protein